MTPLQIIELKALMGDASDNIPGIPGRGEKTAAKIIGAYGSIENAYAHVDEIKPNKAKESLQQNYDKAQLSKELATIDVDSPVAFELENARIGSLYTEKAFEICKRLEFKNLLSRFSCEAPANQVTEAFCRVVQLQDAEQVFERAKQAERAGIAFLIQDKKILRCSRCLWGEGYLLPAGRGVLTQEYLCARTQELLEAVPQAGTLNLKEQLPGCMLTAGSGWSTWPLEPIW